MKSLSPNMMVYNVNDTIDYYQSYFDFVLTASVPEEGQFQWAMMTSGNVTLMFQSKESIVEELPEFAELEPGGACTLFIKTNDVEKLYENLKDNVEVIIELHKTFYNMNEFSIRDLNGYIITFAEDAE